MKINKQIQPCDESCVATCIAMLIDEPVEMIMGDFHDRYMHGGITIPQYLDAHGIKHKEFNSIEWITDQGRYLVLAPSLNTHAKLHTVIMDISPYGNYVYDPYDDGEHHYYVSPTKEVVTRCEVRLYSFAPMLKICTGE
jgi:hypothetical protein